MNKYRIYHRRLKTFAPDVGSDSAENACHSVGWLMGECWIRQFTTEKINPESGNSGGGWKNVTPREAV